jgi:NADH-quinone oxidoreductase subunit L
MTIPLSILAVLSIIGGYVGIPHVLGGSDQFGKFLEPVMKGIHAAPSEAIHMSAGHSATTELLLMVISVALVLFSIYMAYYFYLRNTALAGRMQKTFSGIYRILYGKYFVDELYGAVIVRPLVSGSIFLWKIVDVILIDGLLNGLAYLVGDISRGLRHIQTGRLRNYVTVFALGVIIIMGIFIFR